MGWQKGQRVHTPLISVLWDAVVQCHAVSTVHSQCLPSDLEPLQSFAHESDVHVWVVDDHIVPSDLQLPPCSSLQNMTNPQLLSWQNRHWANSRGTCRSAFQCLWEGQLWIGISNCSQNECQFRMLPSNLRISSLGSLTPSVPVVEGATSTSLEDKRRLAFNEQLYIFSRILFSSFMRSSSPVRSSNAES